jgi:hypothetical protein
MPKAVEQLIQIGKLVDLEVAPHRPRHRRTKLSEAGALIDLFAAFERGEQAIFPLLAKLLLVLEQPQLDQQRPGATDEKPILPTDTAANERVTPPRSHLKGGKSIRAHGRLPQQYRTRSGRSL